MEAKHYPILILLGALPFQMQCNNVCQQVCVRMADYAAECGYVVKDREMDACLEDHQKIESPDERRTCRVYGTTETITQEWDCEDLDLFWGNGNESNATFRTPDLYDTAWEFSDEPLMPIEPLPLH